MLDYQWSHRLYLEQLVNIKDCNEKNLCTGENWTCAQTADKMLLLNRNMI